MTFSYLEYFMNNLMLPVFALVFIAVPTFRFIQRAFKYGFAGAFGDGMGMLFFAVMIIAGVVLGGSLFNGGIHLAYERAKDAVEIQGTIEEIKTNSPLKGIRYVANGEASFGYEYTIDGVTCTGMALGDLEVGDEVTVSYLPKSGFVLSIEEVNP